MPNTSAIRRCISAALFVALCGAGTVANASTTSKPADKPMTTTFITFDSQPLHARYWVFGSWLEAIARAWGEALDKKAAEMVKLSG